MWLCDLLHVITLLTSHTVNKHPCTTQATIRLTVSVTATHPRHRLLRRTPRTLKLLAGKNTQPMSRTPAGSSSFILGLVFGLVSRQNEKDRVTKENTHRWRELRAEVREPWPQAHMDGRDGAACTQRVPCSA